MDQCTQQRSCDTRYVYNLGRYKAFSTHSDTQIEKELGILLQLIGNFVMP